jgi:hypothetical protein
MRSWVSVQARKLSWCLKADQAPHNDALTGSTAEQNLTAPKGLTTKATTPEQITTLLLDFSRHVTFGNAGQMK